MDRPGQQAADGQPAVGPAGAVARLPNILTVLRLMVVPAFVYAMYEDEARGVLPFLLFASAAITDFLDGYLARKYQVESAFGRVVDPLADRLLIVSATLMLVVFGRLSPWALAVVVGRDAAVLVGWLIVRKRRMAARVNFIGKSGTALMMLGIGFLILVSASWPLYLFWAGVGVSVLAFFTYMLTYLERARRGASGV